MSRPLHARPLAAACAVLVASAAMPQAHGATLYHLEVQTGGNACTGALPAHEGALRKRPQAISNEGTTAAFVTCSLQFNDANTAKPAFAIVNFGNSTAAPLTVSCTAVDGYVGWGAANFYPETFTIPAATAQVEHMFSPPGKAATFQFPAVGVSCNLPPGLSVNYYGYGIDRDVGM